MMLDAARWALVLGAASLPFSTAAINVFVVLAVFLWAMSGPMSGQFRATAHAIVEEPAAWLGWMLFAALAIGIAWSRVSPAEGFAALNKYRELALFGIAMFLMSEPRWRGRLFHALFFSTTALLIVSYAIHLGWLPPLDAERHAAQGAVVLRHSITHSFLVSLLALAAAILALREHGWRRWTLAALALLAAANVFVAVKGRTGYVVLAVLFVWIATVRWSLKGFVVALLAVATLTTASYRWAPAFQSRMHTTIEEVETADPTGSSVAHRMHFLKRSWEWIAAHPWFGVGTGAWVEAFHESTRADHPFFHNRSHTHPHNEYVHLAVQIGIGGAALLAAMFVMAFLRARALPADERHFAQGFVLAFALGCLFNDFFWDMTEGHLWALLGGALFGATRRTGVGTA